MAIARPVRALGLVAVVLWVFFLYQIFGTSKNKIPEGPGDSLKHLERDPNLDRESASPSTPIPSDPFLAVTGEPEGILHRADEGYEPDNPNSARINATILTLVRNSELDGIIQAMTDLERTWNSKFNYPWTFFNDEPFTEEFKKRTRAATNAECRYGERIDTHFLSPD